MRTESFIAARYLFAKKSHNVINVISAISAIGMAIGTAALILILSVYNGFDRIIQDNMSDLDADILVIPATGKYFIPDEELYDSLAGDSRILSIAEVLEENVFLSYGDQQDLAKAKGVDDSFNEHSSLSEHLVSGEFSLHLGDVPFAVVGAGLASRMGINPSFLEKIEMHYPKTGSRNPLAGPASSLGSVKVAPSGIFSINSTVDSELLIVPLNAMQELLGIPGKVSGVEIRLSDSADGKFVKELQERIGSDFKILDRYSQNPSLYKMMRYEKLSIFIILIFVVIIIAFNIFGSLSMLIIEKQEDMSSLRAMGATDRMVKRIFVLEGWMVSLLGLAAGLVAGIALALLQQRFGFVKMPGGFYENAYPVVLKLSDVILTAAGVALIGFLVALLAASEGRTREQRA